MEQQILGSIIVSPKEIERFVSQISYDPNPIHTVMNGQNPNPIIPGDYLVCSYFNFLSRDVENIFPTRFKFKGFARTEEEINFSENEIGTDESLVQISSGRATTEGVLEDLILQESKGNLDQFQDFFPNVEPNLAEVLRNYAEVSYDVSKVLEGLVEEQGYVADFSAENPTMAVYGGSSISIDNSKFSNFLTRKMSLQNVRIKYDENSGMGSSPIRFRSYLFDKDRRIATIDKTVMVSGLRKK